MLVPIYEVKLTIHGKDQVMFYATDSIESVMANDLLLASKQLEVKAGKARVLYANKIDKPDDVRVRFMGYCQVDEKAVALAEEE